MKPIAERIEPFSKRKILYRCFKCGVSFSILGERAKYCYNCGINIDWDGIVLSFNDEVVSSLKNDDEDSTFEKNLIDELNIQQLGKDFTDLYDENKKPKSCNNCIHAVEVDECEIPENERENILIPARNGYCHSAICNKYKIKE